MFDIGFSEMILLAAIALVAIGPKQLPEVARTIGRTLNELKRATGDLSKTVLDARNATNESFMSVANKITEDLHRPPQMPMQSNNHDQFAAETTPKNNHENSHEIAEENIAVAEPEAKPNKTES